MNKSIKLSLAAAMVAGMVSNANAKVNLEDAIKNVTLKGYVSYTMEKLTDNNGKDSEAQHDIDVRVQIDSKINDNYSLTVRIDEANDDDKDDIDSSSTKNEKKDSSALKPEIDQVYMTYKDGALKAKVGMQKVVAPRLHDSLNGDGVNVSYKLSDAVKLSGGYFYTTEENRKGTKDAGSDEYAGLSLSGKAGILKYGVGYTSVIDSDENNNDGSTGDNGATAIDLTLDAKVSALNIHAAHTSKSLDATGEKDQKLTKLVASGKAGDIKYALGYAMAGKDGAKVSLDNDGDASVNLVLDEVSSHAIQDGNVIYAMIGTKLTDTVSASFEYVTADGDSGSVKEANEIELKLTNKITKKLKAFVTYDTWETKDFANAKIENTEITLGAKYSF